MAVHTMSRYVEGAWTGLATIQSYTADLGVLGRNLDAERAEQVLITNGEAATAEVFIVGVGSNKGVIKIATGNVAEADCIMIGDGVHVPDIYEADEGVKATGSIALAAANADAGDVITVGDGVHAAIGFECDGVGAYAFALGADNLATLVNLVAQMVLAKAANLFAITAVDGDAGTVTLTNDAFGTAGNVAITKAGTGAADWTIAGMSGGLNAGSGPVTGTHIAFAKGANASASATDLAAKINASAVGNYTAGTPYADADTPTTYCVPITGDSSYDRMLMDTFGANITVVEGTQEYQQNQIGVQEVTGSPSTSWTPLAASAQKVTMTSIAGGGAGTGIFQITKGLNGLCLPGLIQADIIVLPHLVAANTTIGAFTAATDKVVATGVVRNR